jgi:glycosyltransferase involved in cell wall biosynthesis
MKILSIAPTPFFSDRGCHVRILEETKALMELGHDVTICTYHIGRDIDNIKTKRIPKIPWYNKLEAGPSYHMLYLDALLLFRSLQITIKEKPDIIHAHLHEGALIGKFCSKLRNVPLVFDVQGSLTGEMTAHGFVKSNSFLYKIIFKLETIINNMADAMITSSANMAEILKKQFQIDECKVFVIPDAVDTNIFHPNYDTRNLRKGLDIDDDKKIIVYLGILNEYQGVDLLIKSVPHIIKEVSNAHFLIMGFPKIEKYQKMAQEIGVLNNITFTGRIDYCEAPLYLNLGDIAVSPKNTSSGEGNGKIYNYMACGLPTVVLNTPTNNDILGSTGIYLETMDSKLLAEKLIELLLSDKIQDELSLKVREKAVNEYSWLKVGNTIINVYKKIDTTVEG